MTLGCWSASGSRNTWLLESRHRPTAPARPRSPTPPAGLTAVRGLAGESSLQEQLRLTVSRKMSSSGQCCRRFRLRGSDCATAEACGTGSNVTHSCPPPPSLWVAQSLVHPRLGYSTKRTGGYSKLFVFHPPDTPAQGVSFQTSTPRPRRGSSSVFKVISGRRDGAERT